MPKTVVIVGASTDRSKYGNKAVRAYTDAGWTVYPVNPKASEVEGIKAYPSVADVPGDIDRVAMYVPPAVGKTLLEEIAAKEPGEVLFNPGSDDDDVVEDAQSRGLKVVQGCAIVALGRTPAEFADA